MRLKRGICSRKERGRTPMPPAARTISTSCVPTGTSARPQAGARVRDDASMAAAAAPKLTPGDRVRSARSKTPPTTGKRLINRDRDADRWLVTPSHRLHRPAGSRVTPRSPRLRATRAPALRGKTDPSCY